MPSAPPVPSALEVVAQRRAAAEQAALDAEVQVVEEEFFAAAAERDRLARIDALRVLIRDHFGGHEGDVVAAFDRAVAALVPLVKAVKGHNAGLTEVLVALAEVAPLPDDLRANGTQLHLRAVDVFVDQIDPVILIVEAGYRAALVAGDRPLAGAFSGPANIGFDRDTNRHLGIVETSSTAAPSGLSDRLRRVARIVAGREGAA